jgi:hypothetical protein
VVWAAARQQTQADLDAVLAITTRITNACDIHDGCSVVPVQGLRIGASDVPMTLVHQWTSLCNCSALGLELMVMVRTSAASMI